MISSKHALDAAFIAAARTDVPRLLDEVERLQTAIRKHRDYRGDDRCFQDDAELYAILPEGDTRSLAATAVTLENCARYIECRQQGREYISPQRRIEELEAEVRRLQGVINGLAERVAAQSELLSQRAERENP